MPPLMTSSPSDDSFVKEKNSPHRWTEEQKAFICVLKRWFLSRDKDGLGKTLTPRECRQMFCSYFADTFRLGREKTLTVNAIISMWADMKAKKASVWRRVCEDTPFSDPNRTWETYKIWIVRVSICIGLDLVEKSGDLDKECSRVCPVKRKRKPLFSTADDTSVTDWSEDEYDKQSSDCEIQPPYSARRIALQVSNGSLETNLSLQRTSSNSSQGCAVTSSSTQELLLPSLSFQLFDRDGNLVLPYRFDEHYRYTQRTEGMIAFRCWDEAAGSTQVNDIARNTPDPTLSGVHGINSAQGFWAGDFNGEHSSPPSRNAQDTFGKSIFIHLRPLKQHSPWISVWISLISSVHRLLRKSTAHLTLIDLDYLGRLKEHEYPIVYPAGTLISQYRLKEVPYPNGMPYRYGGQPEFLIWKHIPGTAILGSRSHNEFMEHLKVNKMLGSILSLEKLAQADHIAQFRNRYQGIPPLRNKATGESIGAALAFMGIPTRFVKRVAMIAASNWRFSSGSNCGNARYLLGVEAGYNSSGASPFDSMNNLTILVDLESRDGRVISDSSGKTNELQDLIADDDFSNEASDVISISSDSDASESESESAHAVKKGRFQGKTPTELIDGSTSDNFMRQRRRIECIIPPSATEMGSLILSPAVKARNQSSTALLPATTEEKKPCEEPQMAMLPESESVILPSIEDVFGYTPITPQGGSILARRFAGILRQTHSR